MSNAESKAAPPDEFMLDLATLHGAERPLVVKMPDGARYELKRREAMGPADVFLLDKVMRRLREMGGELDSAEELTEAQAKRVHGMVQDTIKALSPELAAAGLCFADMYAILAWYDEQARKDAAAKGDAKDAKNAPSA